MKKKSNEEEDKVTINRRTVDVVAILTVVPEAPASSMLQSYVVAAPVVKLHDGASLAKEIQEALATIGVTKTEQLAAIAADGQYHRLGVPEKLLSSMRAEGQERSGPACVAAIWDSAHLMNLAEADARKEHLWVQETIKVITEISKRFTYGKGLEELMDTGKQMGIRTKRPKLWSGTRFAPHAATVLGAFLHNWEPMKAVLRERLQTETRKEYAAEILGDLKKLKDDDFKARVAALKDVYDILGRGSREVQRVQSLPWESRRGYRSTVASVKCVRTAVEAFSASARTATEAADAVAHADLDELCPTLSRHKAALRKGSVATDVVGFGLALETALKTRSHGTVSSGGQRGTSNKDVMDAMCDIRDVADLQRLQTGKALASGVADASRRLIIRRLIPPSAEVSAKSAEAAIRLLGEASQSLGNAELLRLLWSRRSSNAEVQQYLETCIRLWLLSPPESVVESMASVLGEVFGAHRNLDHENAAKELVIRWNGPDLAHSNSVVASAAASLRKKFRTTSDSSRLKTALGAVIAGRMAKQCPRASVFK
ncbi:hypothetical protein FJT64_018091 [Amphibalanus amphitrite]|uniref:Uncharacterized protein n=1 Tax=Amphibalanus amphitrite TaxID=1232801 RepID=A0A6A4X4Z1_AMPAM|nr:hypothetical protein FJT64_018091 [Amphibalanus amphitrite]